MEIILAIPFFTSLFLLYKTHKKPFLSLTLLQIVSFLSQFLVARSSEYESVKTLFNLIFINLNLFLIIAPWCYAKITIIEIKNVIFFVFFRKILFKLLQLNILLNIFILVLVLIYIPDIASFKNEQSFRKLYEQIPYFANIFRYAYISQYLGYFAIPIFFYYVGKLEHKKSILALICACSSLISGFAFYSRAQIFTFVLTFFIYFLLVKNTFPLILQKKIIGIIKIISLIVVLLFLLITVVRFSSMDYYSDRIPKKSIIKNPIIYSLIDYASQGYPNGINQLEVYTENKNLKGEQMFRDVYQILNFFKIINWNAEESQNKIDKAYNYDGGAFNGYTCHLVFNFGYLLTLLISIIYYLSIKFQLKNRLQISLEKMITLVLLLVIPTVSIFYSGYAILYFPFLFLLFVKFLFFLKIKRNEKIHI